MSLIYQYPLTNANTSDMHTLTIIHSLIYSLPLYMKITNVVAMIVMTAKWKFICTNILVLIHPTTMSNMFDSRNGATYLKYRLD